MSSRRALTALADTTPSDTIPAVAILACAFLAGATPDGAPASAGFGEQCAQEFELGDRGVLELIQQDRAKARSLDLPDHGESARHSSRQGHLVGEVERPACDFQSLVGFEHRHQHPPAVQIATHGLALGEQLTPAGFDPGHPRLEGIEPLGQSIGCDEMLGHLGGQVDHGVGDGRLGPPDLLQRAVITRHGFIGELPGRSLR